MMVTGEDERPAAKKIGRMTKRRVVSLSTEELVRIEPLEGVGTMPVVIKPSFEDVSLTAWAGGNRSLIEDLLFKHGAILFRNFSMSGAEDLEEFIKQTSDEWATYREPATPRNHVSGHIFTSTEYPADQTIFLHNENSHCDSWPMKIFFLCVRPASEGGETPIADCRRVFDRISRQTRERFIEKRIMYVRNFGRGLGFSWQTVFNTSSKEEVDEYCQAHGMSAEWQENYRLRIRYVRDAVACHPKTKEWVWFNHGAFFNAGLLDPETSGALLAEFNPEELPYNTYYGNGEPIEPHVLEELRDAYVSEIIRFPYEEGDLLMLDNMLVAHGRSPFEGERRVLVGMADSIYSQNLTFSGSER